MAAGRQRCEDEIAAPVRDGRLALDPVGAAACIARVQRAGPGWIGPHAEALNLAPFEECRGISRPHQARGDACRTALECRDGLGCLGAETGTLGSCRESKAGEACAPQSAAFGVERRSECPASMACSPTPPGTVWGDNEASLGRLGSDTGGSPGLRAGDIAVGPGLPQDSVSRIVRQNFGRFRKCYELGLARDPALSGKVTVAFTVSKDGEVRTATVNSATLPATDVQACTAQAFRHLSFPPPQTGAPVEVVYAIKFQSPSEADPRHVESGAAQRGEPRTSEPVSATSWMQGGRGTCGARAASATCAVHLDCTVDQYCATPPAPGEPNRCQPKRPEGSECASSAECRGICFARECTAICGSG